VRNDALALRAITPSGSCRSTRSRRRSRGTPARRWGWRRWRTCCGRAPAIQPGESRLGRARPVHPLLRHASMLLYSLLHLTGFDVSLDDLKEFRQWGSRTPGHPRRAHPGRRGDDRPLGQGFGNAVGWRWPPGCWRSGSTPRARDRLPPDRGALLRRRPDGGGSSEAASLAGFHRLGNLVAFYDDNRITIEGSTDLAFREDVGGRFRAYGWNVLTVADGNTDLAGWKRRST